MSRNNQFRPGRNTVTLRGISGIAVIAGIAAMSMVMQFRGCPGGSVSVTCPSGTVMVGQSVNVSSTQTNGTAPITFVWSASPTGSGTFGNANAEDTTFSPSQEGTITLTVTATDSSGSVSDSCTITVTGIVELVAAATGPAALDVGEAGNISVTVTGATGTPTIAWTATQGAFGNGGQASTTFTPDAAGTATVTVTVTDGTRTATDSFDVTVTEPLPAFSVAISGPTAINQGATGTYTASATNAGAGGATFAWTVAGQGSLDTTTGASVVLTGTGGGTATLTVTATDTDTARTATDDQSVTVTAVSQPPTVTITANPGTEVEAGTALQLTATAADPQGLAIVSTAWTLVSANPPLTANPFSNPNGAVTNFNSNSPGTYTVQASVTNAAGAVGTATLDLTITPSGGTGSLTVNAGADQQVVTAFAAGAQLTSTGLGGALPPLTGVANDQVFNNAEISFSWAITAVPDGADVSQVAIVNTSANPAQYRIIPALSNSALTINEAGTSGNLTNIVVPGDYTFTVTAINPNGDTATDSVTYNVNPAFTMVPTATGQLNALSFAGGSLLRHVIRPNTAADVALKLLARLTGTLSFSLVDGSDQTNAGTLVAGAGFYGAFSTDAVAPQAQESLDMVPASPVAVVDQATMIMSTMRGTYFLTGQLASSAASVAATFLGEDQTAAPGDNDVLDVGDLPFGVHVSGELTGAVDTRAPFVGTTLQHFGLVNSTNSTSAALLRTQFHGARAAAGGNEFWDGEVIFNCDLNNDGWPEVITADGNVLTFLRGINDDPTQAAASPIDNTLNNGGLLTEGAAGTAGTLDTFALTDANMTGTVPDVTQVTALACGDLDNDGNVDLVVGEGGFNGGVGIGAEGRVLVFYGQNFDGFAQNPFTTAGALVSGGALLAQPRVVTRTDGVIAGILGRDDHFGHALAVCNFNNDGFDDLIIGCPGGGQAITAAASGILVNGAAQVGQALTVDTVDATTIFEAGDIAVVDSNNTAQSLVRRVTTVANATTINFDLAIGVAAADNENVDEIVGMTGAVFGFNGNLIRLPNTTTVDDAGSGANFRIIPTSSNSGDLIGVSIACGDVSGDGIDDIVFGAPGRKDSGTAAGLHVAAGAVFVTNGRAAGLSGNVNTIDRIFEGNAAHLGFGRAVAVGNFNGAAGLDIAVSAAVGGGATPSLGTAGTGRVYILASTQSNIQTAADGTSALANVPQANGAAADSDLGIRLAAFDFNGDSSDDLAATAPSVTDANQRVYVINGATTLAASLTFAVTISNGANPAGGWLSLPTGSTLTGADSPLDVRAVLYFADGMDFVDVNGDWVDSDGDGADDQGRNTFDLVFQGDAAVANPAYAIMGAQ